jgi:hypothetical protein
MLHGFVVSDVQNQVRTRIILPDDVMSAGKQLRSAVSC